MSKILWISWKDTTHPLAGGAELVSFEIQKRLAKDGHEVTLLTRHYENSDYSATIEGINIIRLKSPLVLFFLRVILYYLQHMRGNFDIIVEEVNTSPYFIHFIKKNEKHVVFYHQLTREVWDFESKIPLNVLGKYILEPLSLLLNRKVKTVLAMSKSTADDLISSGYSQSNVHIIPEATDLQPLPKEIKLKKEPPFSILYFGSMRAMKRPEHVIEGFARGLKETKARLVLSGAGTPKRIDYLKSLVKMWGIEDQTTWTKLLNDQEKIELFKEVHIVSMTSVREGWGLVAMEAGMFETPAVVYNVPGLRDAVINKKTGIIVSQQSPALLGKAFRFLYENQDICKQLGKNARAYNETFNFERTYNEFAKYL